MDTRRQARLRQQQAQQHQDQSCGVQPSPLAVRRIGNASAFRLAPGVAGNSKQLQIPPSPRTLQQTNRLLLACQVYCCTYCYIAVLLHWVGPWVDGGWWMAARSLPEMAEYLRKIKLPPSVSCFTQGPQEPTNFSPRTRSAVVHTSALLHCCM